MSKRTLTKREDADKSEAAQFDISVSDGICYERSVLHQLQICTIIDDMVY